MTDPERQRRLYLALRRAFLAIIGALDEYFGVAPLRNSHDNGGVAPALEM